MVGVAWTFAVIAGLAHVGAFVMESFLFHRPGVQRLMLGRVDSAPDVQLWAFNQGFYNLFLALGAFTGVAAWAVSDETTVGRTLIVFCCAAMALAGIVLIVSDRSLWRGGLGQFLPPAVAVVAALAA